MLRGSATAMHQTLGRLRAYLAPAASLKCGAQQRICLSPRYPTQCYRGEGDWPVGKRRPSSDERSSGDRRHCTEKRDSARGPRRNRFARRYRDRLTAEERSDFCCPGVRGRCRQRADPGRMKKRGGEYQRSKCRERVHPSIGQHLSRVPLAPLLDDRACGVGLLSLPELRQRAGGDKERKQQERPAPAGSHADCTNDRRGECAARCERARTVRKERDGDNEQAAGDCPDERFSQL